MQSAIPSRKFLSTVHPVASPATGNNTTTQTDLPRKHAAIQVSKCRVCLCFLLVSDDSSEYTCGRYAQVEEPVSLVLKLQEKVGRLKSIRVSEGLVQPYSTVLKTDTSASYNTRSKCPLHSHQQAAGGKLRDREEWKQVLALGGMQIPFLPNSPSQVPSHNR